MTSTPSAQQPATTPPTSQKVIQVRVVEVPDKLKQAIGRALKYGKAAVNMPTD